MKPLLAELIEFYLSGEVGSDDLFDSFGDGRLERVTVYPVKCVQLLCGKRVLFELVK